MGSSNNSKRACNLSILGLQRPGSRHTWCRACNLHLWRFLIRYRAQRPSPTTSEEHEGLARALYFRQPGGLSWGLAWDQAMFPRLKTALYYRFQKALQLGLACRLASGSIEWQDWATGFLHDEWDGACFDRDYGQKLLLLSRRPDASPSPPPSSPPAAAAESAPSACSEAPSRGSPMPKTEQIDDDDDDNSNNNNNNGSSVETTTTSAATNTQAESLGSEPDPSRMASPDQDSNDNDAVSAASSAAEGAPVSVSPPPPPPPPPVASEFSDPFVARPPPPSSIASFGVSTTTELKPDDSITYIGARMAKRNTSTFRSRRRRGRRRGDGGGGGGGSSSSRLGPIRENEPLATGSNPEDVSVGGDQEDMAWWRAQPLQELWPRLCHTVDKVWAVREQAVGAYLLGAGVQQYKQAVVQREDRLEELCFLDNLIDLKLQEELVHPGKKARLPVKRYPMSGLVWKHYLWPGEISPILDDAILLNVPRSVG